MIFIIGKVLGRFIMNNDDLITKLKKEKETGIEYQKRRHEPWKGTYELYRDIVETNELTQRQEVNIPIMKETKKTLMSRIDDAPDVIFDCLEQGVKGREKEIVIEEIWQDDFDKCNFVAVDISEKNNVLLYGRTFKFLNFVNDKFSVEVPDNLDVVIDPKTNPIDIESARFIIRLHIFKSLREILADPKYLAEGKQKLKKYLQGKEDDEGGGLIQFEKEKNQEARDEILEGLGVENFDEFGAADVNVELNEHLTLIWDEGKKKYIRYVVVTGAGNAILYKETLKETLGIDFWPAISWADDLDTKDFWTDGIGDVVRVPNKVMNIYFSTMLENRTYRNLGMMWYLPVDGYNPQTFEPEPFGQYPAPLIPNKQGGYLTVDQVIKQMDIPALEDNLLSIDFLIKIVERACYSEDTETLTENGWKYYWEVQDNEKIATFNPKKQKIEYHLPIKKYVYDYEGEMYHYHKDKSVDLLVSPEHKIWYRKIGHREPSDWMLKPANEIKENNIEFLIGADWDGEEKKVMILPRVEYLKQKKKNKGEIKIEMDIWLEFLGYVLSEGGMDVKGGLKGHYNLDIAQKDEVNIKKIRSCLTKLPFKFTERRDKDNYARFDIANKTLWTYLYQNIGAYCNEKQIPKEIKSLSKRQLKILFDAYMLGDGSIDKRKNRNSGNALSVSKKLADDLQEIGLKLGYKSKVIERQDKRGGNRKVHWRISFTFDNSVNSMITPELRLKKDLTIEKYKGTIYCFEVPNHLFVTRRNGLISIQGNTAATAIEKGVGEKKQITLGEVEELTAKASERIVSIAKFYRRAWKEFAWKWRKMREANASDKSPIKLYKKGVKGNYFEKEIYSKDWVSSAGYKEKVMSSAEQEGEEIKGIQKLLAIAEKFSNNPAIQKLVQTRMLEMLDLTPDELRDIKQAEEQAPQAGAEPAGAATPAPGAPGPRLAQQPV